MKNCSTIFILDKNQNSIEILKTYLVNMKLNCDIKSFSNYTNALNELEQSQSDPVVFVDISQHNHDMLEVFEKIKLFSSKIIVTSNDYSTNTIIKAMRLGAREFLPKPIIETDLSRALSILNQQSISAEDYASKIITIYSNKGGIGKTTIATNLAVELSKSTRNKVALIDLNLQLGDISSFLNLNPQFDVAYVVKNLIDKKESSILQAFEQYKDTSLYVLSDPNYIEEASVITPQQIESLFKILKRMFSYIIIDMSSNIDSNSLTILDKSDWILFTTIVNLPAIRNAQRCLNLFHSRHYPNDKVKLIINRYMENDDITFKDIETTIGEKIYWKIPNNYFSIMEAINKGVPVNNVSTSSNIANSFRDLALKISDDIIEQTLIKFRGAL